MVDTLLVLHSVAQVPWSYRGCFVSDGRVRFLWTIYIQGQHLISSARKLIDRCIQEILSYIRTFLSSPADANMDGSAGFHDTAFTQPFVWPSRVSINLPFSLCQMYTLESRK